MFQIYFISFIALLSCNRKGDEILTTASQWSTYEINLISENRYSEPYLEVDAWALFKNEKGDSLIRPAFWDGLNKWKIRFATPDTGSVWEWKTYSSVNDTGLSGQTGSFRSVPNCGSNNLLKQRRQTRVGMVAG